MALLTMIARVIDGLPLVGTMQDDEQVGRRILSHFRKILDEFVISDRTQYYGVSESS